MFIFNKKIGVTRSNRLCLNKTRNNFFKFQFLSKKDKSALRAGSKTLLKRIDDLENTFKVWKIKRVDSNKLRRIADEIQIIEGIYDMLK